MAWCRGAVVLTGVVLLAAGCSDSSDELPGSGGASGSGSGGSAGVGGSAGTTSSSGGASASGGGGAGGAGGGADACDSCLETKCGAELDACDANPECIAIDDCLETCQDEACYDQCFAAHPAGQAAFDAIESCDYAQCSVECESGGSGGSGGGTSDPCELCVEAKCAPSLDACLADPDCTAFWDCVDPCQDEACENQCVAQHPGGVVKSDAVDACVEQQCPTECAF